MMIHRVEEKEREQAKLLAAIEKQEGENKEIERETKELIAETDIAKYSKIYRLY